jgi:hypothetical protein
LPFIKLIHSQLVFFGVLLISIISQAYNAQTIIGDTIKKVKVDSLTQGVLGDKNDDNNKDESIESQIKYGAQDSVVGIVSEGKVYLYGKATVVYESMNMQAEFIEIDYTKSLITASGKKDSLGRNSGSPKFADGGQEMIAEKIMYNLKSKRGKIFNALTKQGELLVIGNEIKKDSNNVIYFKDMKCIPCQYEDARTVFRATKAKVIPDDKIVTGPVYLEIGGVPTPLGLPFGFFPNTKKQHNGILLPTFGNSPSQGYNLREGGFYWGINDKTDMIIRGDIYTNGSYALRTNNNYNVLYKANGYVNLLYSNFNIGDRDIPSQFSKQEAYEVRWLHNQDNKSNPSIRFSANVNFVKNQTFNRLNAINSGQFLQNNFNSNVSFSKTFKFSSLSLNATHNQSSVGLKPVEISFPVLTYNVNRFFPFKRENAVKQNVFDKIGVSYLLEAKNTLRGYDSTIFSGDINKKLQYGVRHSLPISTNFNLFKYVTVTPGLQFSSVMYTASTRKEFIKNLTPTSNIKTDTVAGVIAGYDANFSTGLNTKVFFDYLFRKGKVQQIRHLLIPSVTYNYRPDFGKEQYGFWKQYQLDTLERMGRYSVFEKGIFGGPGQGEQNAISINLSNNIEAKLKHKTDTGISYSKTTLLQNLSLSGAYNFAADSFNMSDISVTARNVFFKYFDVNASSQFSPYAYDTLTKRTINKYNYNINSNLARFVSASFAVGANFGSDKLSALRKLRQPPDLNNGAERGVTEGIDKTETLPWNINMNYNLQLVKLTGTSNQKIQPVQTLNFSGDIAPTKFWKIGVTSGYDFNTQKLSYTSLNIYRDLKCWEANIQWVPFGALKSYRLTINLKSSMFSDFKIPKSSPPINNL